MNDDNKTIEDGIEITKGVFLGNMDTANNFDFIKRNRIVRVLNCTKDIPNFFSGRMLPLEKGQLEVIRYLRFVMSDSDTVSIHSVFVKGCKFMKDALGKFGAVFVHCQEGKSRSVTMIISLLLSIKKMSLKDALKLVVDKCGFVGHTIRINDGFKRQLMTFEISQLTERKKLGENIEIKNSVDFFEYLKNRRNRKRIDYTSPDSEDEDLDDEDEEWNGEEDIGFQYNDEECEKEKEEGLEKEKEQEEEEKEKIEEVIEKEVKEEKLLEIEGLEQVKDENLEMKSTEHVPNPKKRKRENDVVEKVKEKKKRKVEIEEKKESSPTKFELQQKPKKRKQLKLTEFFKKK